MTNTPWVIRPAIGDGFAITYRTGFEVKRILVETRADLELLRDALIQHLTPERPASPTHLAVFSVKTAGGAMEWARSPVALAGAPSLDTIAAMESGACGEFDTPSAVLVNLIPLVGA